MHASSPSTLLTLFQSAKNCSRWQCPNVLTISWRMSNGQKGVLWKCIKVIRVLRRRRLREVGRGDYRAPFTKSALAPPLKKISFRCWLPIDLEWLKDGHVKRSFITCYKFECSFQTTRSGVYGCNLARVYIRVWKTPRFQDSWCPNENNSSRTFTFRIKHVSRA